VRGILNRDGELSIAFSPPSLKLRRALLAIHSRPSRRGILAKESNVAFGGKEYDCSLMGDRGFCPQQLIYTIHRI